MWRKNAPPSAITEGRALVREGGSDERGGKRLGVWVYLILGTSPSAFCLFFFFGIFSEVEKGKGNIKKEEKGDRAGEEGENRMRDKAKGIIILIFEYILRRN
jgi:hypothetical protein